MATKYLEKVSSRTLLTRWQFTGSVESAKRRYCWDSGLRAVEAVNEERADPESYVLMDNDGNQVPKSNARSQPTVTVRSSASTGPAVAVPVRPPAADDAEKETDTMPAVPDPQVNGPQAGETHTQDGPGPDGPFSQRFDEEFEEELAARVESVELAEQAAQAHPAETDPRHGRGLDVPSATRSGQQL